MLDISLSLQAIDLVTDQGVCIRAWRAFVETRFIAATGLPVGYKCFVDPGAPFSVIPYSLWRARRLRWIRQGTQLTQAGRPLPGALTWRGIPCELGLTGLYLLDPGTGVRTGPHRVTAKFVQQRQVRALENAAILGMNFLADNQIRLLLDGSGGVMTGYLSVPSP